jgi:hypothetical protein
MARSDSKVFSWYDETLQHHTHDFYRCYKCHALITREEERFRLQQMSKLKDDSQAVICSCRGRKYSPSWPKRMEWVSWPVIRYTIKCVLAQEIAPRLEKRFRFLLPLVEYLAMPKEA